MQKRSRKITAGLLLIIIFAALAILMFFWTNPFTLEKSSGTIFVKKSEQGLYSPPRYYAIVLSSGEEISKSSLTEKQVNDWEAGERVHGYKMGGHFYTLKALIIDLALLGVTLLVSGFFILLGIRVIRSSSQTGSSGSRWKKGFQWKMVKKYLVVIGGLVALYFIGKSALHLYNGTVGGAHVETEAVVTDTDSEYHSSGRGFGHATYLLSLEFKTEDGDRIWVDKNVRKNMFDQFDKDQHISINYRDNNPYKISIQKDTFNIGNLSSPNMLSGIFMLSIMLVAYVISFFNRRRSG